MKKRDWNIKSPIAIFLSAVLLFTSVDFTQVQAQELNNENTQELGEEGGNPNEGGETSGNESSESSEEANGSEEGTNKEINESEEGTSEETSENEEGTSEETSENEEGTSEETSEEEEKNNKNADENELNEIQYVTTPEGAIVLSGFEPLSAADACIVLEEKGTLTDVVSLMPPVLNAYAQAYAKREEMEDSSTEEVSQQSEIEETPEIILQELTVPVAWECSEDYENTDLEQYHFLPKWDLDTYFLEESENLPEIEVALVRGG